MLWPSDHHTKNISASSTVFCNNTFPSLPVSVNTKSPFFSSSNIFCTPIPDCNSLAFFKVNVCHERPSICAGNESIVVCSVSILFPHDKNDISGNTSPAKPPLKNNLCSTCVLCSLLRREGMCILANSDHNPHTEDVPSIDNCVERKFQLTVICIAEISLLLPDSHFCLVHPASTITHTAKPMKINNLRAFRIRLSIDMRKYKVKTSAD